MRRPVVLLDVDGPITDYCSAAHELCQRVVGRVLPPPSEWKYWEDEKAMGLDAAETVAWKHAAVLPRNGLAEAVRPRQGAVEGVYRLLAVADVVFVTASYRGHPTWPHVRYELLKDLWPEVDVVQTSAKHRVAGDFLVDDKLATLEAGGPWKGVLWDMPYNRHAVGIPRVRGWDDLLQAVSLQKEPIRW